MMYLYRNLVKIIGIYICFALFYSCEMPKNKVLNQYISPKYVLLAQKIRFEVAQKLADQFKMMLVVKGAHYTIR